MNFEALKGKMYESNSGEIKIVENVDGSIAHLNTGERIAVERLLDSSFYTEHIDPNAFENKENSFYSYLGNQIRNIDVNNIGNIDQGVSVRSHIPVVEDHETAQRSLRGEYTPSHDNFDEIESKRMEMAKKAASISQEIKSSNQKLKELIGDDEDEDSKVQVNRNLEGVVFEGSKKPVMDIDTSDRETSVTMFDENNTPVQTSHKSGNDPMLPHGQQVDNVPNPIYQMFSQVKRSTNFSLNVKLVEKIPRKDFMKMWEESYEISIIDFLVDEFTKKLLNDPTMIKDQLKTALHNHIYGKPKPRATRKPNSKTNK